MSTDRKCPECGSARLELGDIQSTGRIYFRPNKTKFLKLRTNDVPIVASMCMDCGDVMLLGDLRKADILLDRAKPQCAQALT